MHATDIPMSHAKQVAAHRGGSAKLVVFGVAIVSLFVASFFLPVAEYMQSFLKWVDGLGPTKYVTFGVIYIFACVFLIPGSLLTLGAGFLFGVVGGTVTVSVASVLGATAAFLVGRYLARDWIAQKVEGNERFRAVDEAVGRQGFKIVLLTRLSPVFPFTLLNYSFGLTGVSLRHFFFGSWIGMLPGTVMYVYFGAVAGSLSELVSGDTGGGWGKKGLLAVGFVATIVVTWFVTKIARRALQENVSGFPVDVDASPADSNS